MTQEPYYSDDLVTLWHGDCLELADVWTTADVLICDPPYGVDWPQHSFGIRDKRKSNQTRAALVVEQADNRIGGDSDTATRDAALAAWGAKPFAVFGSWRQPRPGRLRNRLIWHKSKSYPALQNAAAWMSAEEEIYIAGDGWQVVGGKPAQNVITTHEYRHGAIGWSAQVGHPTPKPLPLMEHLIVRAPAGVIADPFAGSGSTLIAARDLGRRCVGVELEERYCELIVKRLAQETLFTGGAS